MSVATTKSLQCDRCGRLEDFGLPHPTSAPALRAEASKAGWMHGRELTPNGWRMPDVCNYCKVTANS